MDLNDLPETIQQSITSDVDITEKWHIMRLPVQRAVVVIPEHERKSYPTDLTDAQWQRIVPLLPPAEPKGRQNGVELREVLNGILYVAGDSHDWRSFPRDLPPMSTVYSYFRQWRLDGTWQKILDALHPEVIPYKVDYRFVMTWQKILDALHSEEYEANGHEELPGATPGNSVSGEAISNGHIPERDDVHDTAPLLDARGNQAVSQTMLSPTHDLSVVVPTTNEPDNIWPLDEQFEVMRYAEWLTAEAKRTNNDSHQEESRRYAEDALRTVTVNGQEFRPFAPFRHALSASKTLTRKQAVVLSILMLGCGLGLLFSGMKLVVVLIALITLLYFSSLLLDFWLTMLALSQSTEEQIDDAIVHALADADWPPYTILCPLYREAEVVPQFVQAMQALDYPAGKLQILFLTEENDAETRKAIAALHLPQHFSIVTVPDGQPRTKPRACNFGLLQATGDYVVIYDAEDIPDPLQLKKAVLTFANHDADVACVQAKLNYYNPEQNLLTRWFTVEYCLWFDLTLPGMQQTKLPLPLGGTSNHFRMELLRKVGAWDPFNVTEDCDLGLRLGRCGLKTIVLDSITYEEANSQVKNWIRQRSRWIKGYLLTYLVYMREPLRYLRQGRLREFLSLQLVIGGKTGVLLVNPLVWALLAIYILFRPIVGGIYHTLFPAPVLYMGTLCLIFGNFFYLYSHLVGCMKRSRYSLIKWALSVPVYWAMMSIAAFMAFYQLIFKPHYWEKTKHGLHLHSSRASSPSTIVEEESEPVATMPSPAFTSTKGVLPLLPVPRASSSSTAAEEELEVTAKLPAIRSARHLSSSLPASRAFSASTAAEEDLEVTAKLPTVRRAQRLFVHDLKRLPLQQWLKDPWLITTLVIACIASSASCWYAFQHHQILLFEDAFSHMAIARRIFDSLTPGLAQIGGVWLPLPHLLMLPFIWNDYLWRTGLAGSFPSMACYLVTTVYLYLAARRLTRNSLASFVGALVFILNPNVLYLQTTPLSELVCIATMTMTGYYFLVWAQDDHPNYLIFAAGSTCLATLARYDNWILFPALLVFIVMIGWIRHQQWVQIEGNLIVFGVLSGLGIGLWLLWCATIFGDPLYFQRGQYSAQAQTAVFLQTHTLETYHNLFQSLRYYTWLCIDTMGPMLFLLAAFSFLVFVCRRRLAPETCAVLVFLAPFCFYVLSLYTGQANLYVPQVIAANASNQIFNVRFGTEMVAPVALFLAMLVGQWSPRAFARHWAAIGSCLLAGVIVLQTLLVVHGGIITLQDGQYGGSCAYAHPINAYLAQHYAGGRILENIFSSKIDGTEAGVELKDIISESSGELWKEALNDPASMVDWIIVRPGLTIDPIVTHIDLQSPAFLSRFTLVDHEQDGISLFHRKGLPPLPTRPLPAGLLTEHSLCRRGQ
jgi:cellulose synthase/poly-beta-1,6-N-acetylglucosamine synthase-like glycosyltransferase/transposase